MAGTRAGLRQVAHVNVAFREQADEIQIQIQIHIQIHICIQIQIQTQVHEFRFRFRFRFQFDLCSVTLRFLCLLGSSPGFRVKAFGFGVGGLRGRAGPGWGFSCSQGQGFAI